MRHGLLSRLHTHPEAAASAAIQWLQTFMTQ
jgi:hypothetical protein